MLSLTSCGLRQWAAAKFRALRGELGLNNNYQGSRTVGELLSSHGIKCLKSMGQNFLIDRNIPEKIARLSGVDKSCGVLEVGPGLGALTLELGRVAGRVAAVELDARLLPMLQEITADLHNVEIVQGDILRLDLAKLVNEKMPGMGHHVCANLPYNITTPALTAFIGADAFQTITVMVQSEVARRICAMPGTPDYGSFTVYANYHAMPETLFDVPPDCFFPRPRVYSSVLRLVAREGRIFDPKGSEEAMFFKVVRAAFGQRRKTLVNALNAVFGNILEKEEIAGAVAGCAFDVRVRGEVLGIDEFAELSNVIGLLCSNR